MEPLGILHGVVTDSDPDWAPLPTSTPSTRAWSQHAQPSPVISRRPSKVATEVVARPVHGGRMLITRERTITRTDREISDCSAISALTRRVRGMVSVGL